MAWTDRIAAALLLMTAIGFTPHLALTTEAFSGARDLKGWCDNMEMDDVHWGLCVGSITAAHDTIMTYQGFEDMNELVCATDTTTRGDVVNAVRAYMEDHPEELDYSLGDVVLAALIDRFPCN